MSTQPKVVPPSLLIRKRMEEMFVTEQMLKDQMGFLSEFHITAMLNGKLKITNKIANKLQEILGVDAKLLRDQYKTYISTLKAAAKE